MSSRKHDSNQISKAETAFRNAFQRLKDGCPTILSKGSKISQNNVAREAGLDPSSLKKARFPILVEEIQNWINTISPDISTSSRQHLATQRRKSRSLRQQIDALKSQRDEALAMLVQADAHIVDLTMANQKLKANLPPSNLTLFPTKLPE